MSGKFRKNYKIKVSQVGNPLNNFFPLFLVSKKKSLSIKNIYEKIIDCDVLDILADRLHQKMESKGKNYSEVTVK